MKLLWILLLMSFSANAGEAIMIWTKPEKNCDGTNLTDLKGFRAYWWPGFKDLPDPTISGFTVKGLTPGTWYFGITAYNSKGEESYFGGPLNKVIAPEDFKTTSETVYTIVKRTNFFIFLPVGTAPIGTICISEQRVNDYFVVPRASVTWSGTIKPDVVVAKCE